MNTKKLTLISAGILSALFTVASQAQTVVIDDNLLGIGTDQVAANAALGADYFATSSSGSAIE